MNLAPSYIAGIVTILMGLQSLLGLDFTSDQWTGAIIVVTGVIVAVRQWLSGRSDFFGMRPKNFTE